MIKTDLYKHQYDNVQRFHLHYPKTADWSDCGIGKSLIALTKFVTLYEVGAAHKLLIVCPLSVMTSWKQEVLNHTQLKITALTGTLEQRINKLQNGDHVYLITYDSIAGKHGKMDMYMALLEVFSGNNMIICDEASMIKSIKANRTKALIALCDTIKFSMFLSGTFMPQDLQDVFTIYRAMDGGETFGENIYSARHQYMVNMNPPGSFPKWELNPKMKPLFLSKLYERAIRVRKEDCVELPSKVFEKKYVWMTPQQNEHYNKMRTELKTELDNKVITSANILTKMTKMQQIVGGFLYDKEGNPHHIGSKKYDTLLEIIRNDVREDEKVVIYARFKEELLTIHRTLQENGYKGELLYGGLTADKRTEVIKSFREDSKVKALIAQIATGGYGLTVVEANHIVYFSMTFSLIDYLQSQDRIHRIGQTKTCIYHFLLTADDLKRNIDEYIYDSVQKNVDITEALSDPKALEKLRKEIC